MGLLEVVGVASILPFMQLMAEPNAIEKSSWLSSVYEYFQFESPRQMLIYSGIGIIILIGVTNIFTVFTTWLQYKFSWEIAHHLGVRLLRTYIYKPYDFYLDNNSSKIKAYIISEVGSLTGGVIIPIIEIFSRLFMSIIILSMLVFVDPKVAMVMFGGLGGAYLIIYLSQKNYLKRIGTHRINMNLLRYQSLQELLQGIKTIMVYNKREFFYDRYHYASREFSDIQPKYNLLLSIPRSLLEFLAFGSILGVTIYLYTDSGNIQSAIPRLSLYAVAGYRLLPAMQKIFTALAKLRHNFPIVNKLYTDLKKSHIDYKMKEPVRALPFQEAVVLDNVSFKYENATRPVIDHLTIEIKKGETVAFIGSTGSGKTTLVDLFVGLLYPGKGKIIVDNTALTASNITQWQKQLAYVPQEVFLFDDSVASNITLGVAQEAIDYTQLEKATRLSDIYDFIKEDLPEGFDTKIGEKGVRLSGGQRQRLGLARALYQSPAVLVLDEATSALDSITEKSIIESLKKLPQDLTTIIIAHRLSTVKHADCIYILDEGKIIAKGTYDSLVDSNKSFQTMVKLS